MKQFADTVYGKIIIGVVVTSVIALGTWVVASSKDSAVIETKLEAMEKRVDAVEASEKDTREMVISMRSDIAHIRKAVDRIEAKP